MTNTSDNTELLEGVANATENGAQPNAGIADPDPAGFDITQWLTPLNQKDHRKTEEVRLIRDFSLEAEIYEYNQLKHRIDKQQDTAGLVDPDRAIGESSSNTADLEQRRQELHERIVAASMVVTVRAMTQPEINKALGGLKPTHDMYWPRVFAQSVEFPDGSMLPVEKWPEFRNTIGEGQFNQLVDAFNKASFAAPVKVNAVF